MRGVPLGLIALPPGHAATRLTDYHYAHLTLSYVARTIRSHFPDLRLGPDRQAVALISEGRS